MPEMRMTAMDSRDTQTEVIKDNGVAKKTAIPAVKGR